MLLLLYLTIATCTAAKIRIALVAPTTTSGDAAIAGAKFAIRNFTNDVELMMTQSNDTNPYQFSKDTATLLSTSPSILVTGLIAVTSSSTAANSVAAEAYYGKHAFVSVGAFDLNLNVGDSSGLRVTASAENMGIAAAGLLQHFGFQQFTILASTEYATVAKVLSEKMKEYFKLGEGGLEMETRSSTTNAYIFPSGESTLSNKQIKEFLTKMKKNTARIVVMLCSKKDANMVLPLAYELQMIRKGWLWAGIGWLDSDYLKSVTQQTKVPREALIGSLSIVPAPWNNSPLATNTSNTGEAFNYYSYTHDAVYALATSSIAAKKLNPLIDPSSDMSFCKIVEKYALNHQFVGITGTISFDHDEDVDDVAGDPLNDRGSREAPPFAVLNVNGGKGDEELKQIFLLSGGNGKILGIDDHKSIMVMWPGSIYSNVPPSDRSILEIGTQSWYIVTALLFVFLSFLISSEGARRGYPSIFQESLVLVTLGVVAGLFLRAGGNDELMATAIFDETVFTFILLPIIIFESGYAMENKNLFFRNLGSIVLLAVPGTLLAALFIGLCLLGASFNGVINLSGPECFATGALLSAIDPVATIGVFGSLGVPKRLSTMITGEAVINDAMAIVLYRTMISFMGEVEPNGSAYVGACFLTLLNLLGSAVVGSIVMMFCALALKILRMPSIANGRDSNIRTLAHTHQHSSEIQVVVLLVFSYLSFTLCEGMTLSGIVSSLSGGLTASLYCAGNMDEKGKLLSKRIFKVLASLSEALIFFNVGLNIALFLVTSRSILTEVGIFLPLVAIILCSVSRLIVLPLLVCCLNCRREENRITLPMQMIMWHAGLRGAIAWALAIKFPSQNRDAIVAATTSVILFTTYLQGGTTTCCLRCVKIPTGDQVVDEDAGESEGTDGSSSRSSSRSRGSSSIRSGRRDQTLPRWMRSIKSFHQTTLKPLLTTEEDSHDRMVDPVEIAVENANL
jgi:NhaP-type Na+/H+ or K+/H+ antiporter